MGVKSTVKRPKVKPLKPRPDFPLYPHAVGKWAKTIRGRAYYFGRWDDPDGAEEEYEEFISQLNGHSPLPGSTGPTVRDICNAFIHSKRIDLDTGRLSPRTFCDYDRVCRFLLDQFHADRTATTLKPKDFEQLNTQLP